MECFSDNASFFRESGPFFREGPRCVLGWAGLPVCQVGDPASAIQSTFASSTHDVAANSAQQLAGPGRRAPGALQWLYIFYRLLHSLETLKDKAVKKKKNTEKGIVDTSQGRSVPATVLPNR